MRYLIFILGCFITGIVSAQQPLFKEIKLTYEGKVLEIHNGLVDYHGMLWICAEDGIYLSDGQNVTRPVNLDNSSIYVTTIIETNDHHIVAGTSKGDILYFENYKKVKPPMNSPLCESSISIIKEDHLGQLVIGTKGKGLYLFQQNQLTHYTQADGLNDDFIYTIAITTDNQLLVGSDRGINFCSLTQSVLKPIRILNDKMGLNDNMVTQLELAVNGVLTIGSQDFGFQLYDLKSNSFLKIKEEEGTISTIANIRNEQWIGFDDGHIMDLEYDPIFMLRPITDRCNELFQKIQKIIYSNFYFELVIANNRIYYTAGEWHEKILPPAKNLVLKCLTYSGEKLYAVYDNGVYCKGSHNEWQRINIGYALNYNAVSSICIDPNGVVWLGSLNDGLIYITPQGITQKLSPDAINYDISIFKLTLIDQRIYIGTMNGIYAVNWKLRSFESGNTPLNNALNSTRGKYIYSISGEANGKLYFGTDGFGYGVIENGESKYFTDFALTPQKSVLNMTETNDKKRIWFSTLDIGLYNNEQNNFIVNDARYTYNKYEILGMSSDYQNNLILIHENLLSILNPENKQQYTLYFGGEGNEKLFNNNMISQTDANIYIGLNDGILSLQPHRFIYPENIPVTILQTYLNLKKLDNGYDPNFNHDEHDISFKCYFPWFQNPEQVRYEYFLEGYSTDTFESLESLISFPNLLPGEYSFKVRGKAEGYLLNTPWTIISFTIHKAWYNTYWFYFLLVIILGLLFYVVVKLRVRQLNRLSEIKTNHLKQEIRVLNSQINPHFLFNSFSSLVGLIETDTKKAVTYTENLADFYRNIVKYKDVESIPIETELNITETYIKLQNIRFNESVRFDVSPEIRVMNKKIPPMTFQILAENAIKHNRLSTAQPLKIKLELNDDYILFSNNLALKLTKENSTNSGLSFVKERILITTGKEIEIEQTRTSFIVKIPIQV